MNNQLLKKHEYYPLQGSDNLVDGGLEDCKKGWDALEYCLLIIPWPFHFQLPASVMACTIPAQDQACVSSSWKLEGFTRPYLSLRTAENLMLVEGRRNSYFRDVDSGKLLTFC